MRNLKSTLILNSSSEMEEVASAFAKTLCRGSIVALFGELGSGKTTFVKSAISSLLKINPHTIDSPTFNYLNIYKGEGELTCYHFDLYRLQHSSDFTHLGFEEFFEKEGVCFLEWAEKIKDLLPPQTIKIYLSHRDLDSRQFKMETP